MESLEMLVDHLTSICDCLNEGVSPYSEIGRTIKYSSDQSKLTPGQWNPESLHIHCQQCDDGVIPPIYQRICSELGLMRKRLGSRAITREATRAIVREYKETFPHVVER